MDNPTIYRDRLRILLILYYFSEPYQDELYTERVKVFRTEVRIQKIDFLLRYPSYLCYELLELVRSNNSLRYEVKKIVKDIFDSDEPVLRTQEMMRFFYGAWEDLDNIISFLKSVNFLDFEAKKDTLLRDTNKYYYLKKEANHKIENELIKVSSADWYFKRCFIIKKYFGDFSGTELKILQYKNETYAHATLGEKIKDVEEEVKEYYHYLFNETL
jgi:hypothetical protein